MSDINTQAKIVLTVEDHATAIVRGLKREFDVLAKTVSNLGKIKVSGLQAAISPSAATKATMAALKSQEAVQTRIGRQRANEAQVTERQRRSFSSAAMADLRRQMAFTARMARQSIAEARSHERERQRIADAAERDAASTLRRQIAGDRWRFQLRERMDRRERQDRQRDRREIVGRGRDVRDHSRDSYHALTRPSAAAAAAVSAVTIGAGQSAFTSRMNVEAAETNLRMFGGELARPGKVARLLTATDVKAIREGWLNEAAISNGISPLAGIGAYTEVLKAGINREKARAMTELVLGAGAGMDMNTRETTRVMGRMSTVMGGITPERMREVMNGMAIAAGETAADPDEIVSGMDRGMGALAYGMKPEDLAAWVAVGRSTGIQSGKTGNFIATMLQNGVGAKNQRGLKLQDMNQAARMVGLGSAQSMSRSAAADPSAFLEQMFERVEAMTIEQRARFSRLMGGQEWDDEILQMKQGLGKLKEVRAAIKDERNRNFLDDNKDLKNASLTGLWARMKSRFALLWETFGDGFSKTFEEVAKYFITSGRAINLDGLRSIGHSFMSGIVKGLGFENWTKLLQGYFGAAGGLDWGKINDRIFRFARGFGEGIKIVADSLLGVARVFAGSDASAEAIGKLSAQVLGFSAALIVAAPAISILGGIASGLLAIGAAAASVFAAMKFTGLIGGTGTAGAGALTAAGGIIAGGFLAAIANAYGILKPPSMEKGFWRGLTDFLDPGLASRLFGDDKAKAWSDPPAKAQKQNSLDDWRGHIHPATMRVNEDLADGVERLNRSITTMGAKIHLASLSGSAASGLSSFSGGGASSPGFGGGGGGDPAKAFGKNFFTPGFSPPSGYGGGGVTAPMLKGEAATNARKAYDFFRAKGLSHEAASGILGNMKHESNFNPKARGDGGKAHGLFQHHADRRAQILRGSGVDMSNATVDKQLEGVWWEMNHGDAGAQRALRDLKRPGITAGEAGHSFGKNFERPAKEHLRWRGRAGEEMALRFGSGSSAATGSDIEGLRLKSKEAIAGGASSAGIVAALKGLQADGLPGGFGRVTAINDLFHKGRRSKHNEGLAGDITLLDPSKSAEAAEAIRAKLRAAGLSENAFKVIDEYRNPSGHSTGGHIHTQFNSHEAAQRYADSVREKTTPSGLASGVPMPPARPSGLGGPPGLEQGGSGFKAGGAANSGPGFTININGANQSPHELSASIQRHVTEAWNYRANDMEPELA